MSGLEVELGIDAIQHHIMKTFEELRIGRSAFKSLSRELGRCRKKVDENLYLPPVNQAMTVAYSTISEAELASMIGDDTYDDDQTDVGATELGIDFSIESDWKVLDPPFQSSPAAPHLPLPSEPDASSFESFRTSKQPSPPQAPPSIFRPGPSVR